MPSRNLPTTSAGDPMVNVQSNHRFAVGSSHSDLVCRPGNIS